MNILINIYIGLMTTFLILSLLNTKEPMVAINLIFHISFIVVGFLILFR